MDPYDYRGRRILARRIAGVKGCYVAWPGRGRYETRPEVASHGVRAEILYGVRERVATITLNRPERLNAWTPHMGKELYAAFAEAAADADVRVIVVTGAGRGFCSGADMQNLRDIQSDRPRADANEGVADPRPATATASITPLHPALDTPYAYPQSIPKPVLAAINGPVADSASPTCSITTSASRRTVPASRRRSRAAG